MKHITGDLSVTNRDNGDTFNTQKELEHRTRMKNFELASSTMRTKPKLNKNYSTKYLIPHKRPNLISKKPKSNSLTDCSLLITSPATLSEDKRAKSSNDGCSDEIEFPLNNQTCNEEEDIDGMKTSSQTHKKELNVASTNTNNHVFLESVTTDHVTDQPLDVDGPTIILPLFHDPKEWDENQHNPVLGEEENNDETPKLSFNDKELAFGKHFINCFIDGYLQDVNDGAICNVILATKFNCNIEDINLNFDMIDASLMGFEQKKSLSPNAKEALVSTQLRDTLTTSFIHQNSTTSPFDSLI